MLASLRLAHRSCVSFGCSFKTCEGSLHTMLKWRMKFPSLGWSSSSPSYYRFFHKVDPLASHGLRLTPASRDAARGLSPFFQRICLFHSVEVVKEDVGDLVGEDVAGSDPRRQPFVVHLKLTNSVSYDLGRWSSAVTQVSSGRGWDQTLHRTGSWVPCCLAVCAFHQERGGTTRAKRPHQHFAFIAAGRMRSSDFRFPRIGSRVI